jgi:hypothetical protein
VSLLADALTERGVLDRAEELLAEPILSNFAGHVGFLRQPGLEARMDSGASSNRAESCYAYIGCEAPPFTTLAIPVAALAGSLAARRP